MMQSFLPTIVLRHNRENLKKCSLRGLENRQDFCFFTYPKKKIENDLTHYLLLDMDAPPLTASDRERGLLIIDSTWRYAEKMKRFVDPDNQLEKRSIPQNYRTAYPRRQDDCPNPELGLASIEAVYIAYLILNRDLTGLLDHYYWKDDFLILNNLPKLFS